MFGLHGSLFAQRGLSLPSHRLEDSCHMRRWCWAQVGCDDKRTLREEMLKLIDHFGQRVAGIDQFTLLPPPPVPLSDTMQVMHVSTSPVSIAHDTAALSQLI